MKNARPRYILPLSILGVALVVLISVVVEMDHAARFSASLISATALLVALLAGKEGRRVGQHQRCPKCSSIVSLTSVAPDDAASRKTKNAAKGASDVGAAVGGAFGIAGKVIGAAVPLIAGAIVDGMRSSTAWKCGRCKAVYRDESALDPPRPGAGRAVFLILAPAGIAGLIVFGLLMALPV